MKKNLLLFCILLFTKICFAQTVGLIMHNTAKSYDSGYVLFSPLGGTTTYLIDKCGKQINTWNSKYRPGMAEYLLNDGSLLRAGNYMNLNFLAGGQGGILEKHDWLGNLTWSYTISDSFKCQHHDMKELPNGNVLAIVWESKTRKEAIEQGRNPSLTSANVWSEQILEIQPIGKDSGAVVWQWHLWDHLIQDFDSTKPNFGNVASNPQLFDINYVADSSVHDWIHLNAIDYNDSLDQILLSAHTVSEIWIIDDSTSTAQAASYSGGNAGKGGDFLYRWGNPAAYKNGTIADQKFFQQHNAHWIKSNLPFGNQIMVFNNGLGRPDGKYSTVEIINPPLSGYTYDGRIPYYPTAPSWIYNEGNPFHFYGQIISSAVQLPDSNVLICNGPAGVFTEVTTKGKEIVWKYVNPVAAKILLPQDSIPFGNQAFRAGFYALDFPGFAGRTLTSGNIIEKFNPISATCSLSLGIDQIISASQIKIYPNPTSDFIYIKSSALSSKEVSTSLSNCLGQEVFYNKTAHFESPFSIPVRQLQEGIYFLKINSGNNQNTFKIIVR